MCVNYTSTKKKTNKQTKNLKGGWKTEKKEQRLKGTDRKQIARWDKFKPNYIIGHVKYKILNTQNKMQRLLDRITKQEPL